MQIPVKKLKLVLLGEIFINDFNGISKLCTKNGFLRLLFFCLLTNILDQVVRMIVSLGSIEEPRTFS